MVKHTSSYSDLLSEQKIGHVTLKNRVVMAAMETNLPSITGEVTDDSIRYYEERAKGGAGAIIVEFTGIDSVTGRGSQTQLLLDSHGFISGHNKLVEAIHKHDCKAFLQLHHAGRQTTKNITGTTPVSASPIACKVMKAVPRELTIDEIQDIVNHFSKAANRAKKAGYDGIEIHAAHGYLLSNFISPYSNQRDDEYGGSMENRARIVVEIIESIRKKVDANFAMIVRFSVDEFVEGGLKIDESKQLAKIFEDAGASAINVSTSIFETLERNIEPMSLPDGWRVPLAHEIKKSVSIPVLAVGSIKDPQMANDIIKSNQADFVLLGRALLADPEWVDKVKEEKTEAIVSCTSCCYCVDRVTNHLPIRCAVNPRAGRENILGTYHVHTNNKKEFAVVGGGAAGLAASVYAARKGHKVHLYEASSDLGGLFDVASTAPGKRRWLSYKNYLLHQVEALHVNVSLNVKISDDDNEQFKESHITPIIATGMTPKMDASIKASHPHVLNVVEVLKNKMEMQNKKILVLGSRGAGLEVAHYLAEQHNEVHLLSRSDKRSIGANIDFINRKDILMHMKKCDVTYIDHAEISAINDKDIMYKRHKDNSTAEISDVDYIILARGFHANDPFNDKNLNRIGSCNSPRKILDCVYEANNLIEHYH